MAETNNVCFCILKTSLNQDKFNLPMEYKKMSDFVVEAMKLVAEENKRIEIIEKLKKGYAEMSGVNLNLAEIGLEQDNLELARYEENLKRCRML